MYDSCFDIYGEFIKEEGLELSFKVMDDSDNVISSEAFNCEESCNNKQTYSDVSVSVFVSSPGEFAAANTDGAEPHGPKPGTNRENNVVRLKGLPYECTREDVALFFQGR